MTIFLRCARPASANSRAPSRSSWRCSALVKVETQTVAARLLRPQRGRGEIAEGLADPGAGFGEQQVGLILRPARARTPRSTAAAIARWPSRGFGAVADQLVEPACARRRASTDTGPRRRAVGRFLPFRQAREQPALAALGRFEPLGDERRPAPAEPARASRWRSTRLRARASRRRRASPAVPPPISRQRRGRAASLAGGSSPSARRSPAASAPRSAPDGRRRTARAGRARTNRDSRAAARPAAR